MLHARGMPLTRERRILVHQVHPAKLATDIVASVISLAMLWRHQLIAGLAVHYVAPVIGSLAVFRFADVDRMAETSAGGYVLRNMPPVMVALRLAGDTLTVFGAWRRRPAEVAVGLLLVALGWSRGLFG